MPIFCWRWVAQKSLLFSMCWIPYKPPGGRVVPLATPFLCPEGEGWSFFKRMLIVFPPVSAGPWPLPSHTQGWLSTCCLVRQRPCAHTFTPTHTCTLTCTLKQSRALCFSLLATEGSDETKGVPPFDQISQISTVVQNLA